MRKIGSENYWISDAGGLVCHGGINGITSSVRWCYNTGDITANGGTNNWSGGIAVYSTGDVGDGLMYKVNISNCYNVGNVFAGSCTNNAYGSVIGHHETGNISGVFYADWNDCNWAYGYGSGTLGCTSFGKNEISGLPAKLGSTYFTNDAKGINKGYPILKWELEIED